jgi:hypothetical protein
LPGVPRFEFLVAELIAQPFLKADVKVYETLTEVPLTETK